MKLRPYQERVLNELQGKIEAGDKEVVLAAAPSSGKTFMAIQHIKRHPELSFLILTHGTNVLKDQWEKELEIHDVGASSELGNRITFGIPQSFVHKKVPKYDVIIIDEAHEFNFAKASSKNKDTYESMVDRIKSQAKPKNQIYLTGTPSKFIAHGLKPIIIPAIELINNKFISDLYVGMVSTTANLTAVKVNGDLKASSVRALEKTVESDLDALLESIVRRLRETKFTKELSGRTRTKLTWQPVLGKLKKTMIACESIVQAEKVQAYFISKGIKTVHSTYKNDPDSLKIGEFVNDPEITVLIVVQRGILGFNMPDLVNVIDLTGSRNIDRIYQLYARVMRKNADESKKYFFKITDEASRELMQFYMNASLQLMFPEFISRYNGKNLRECEVPVMVNRRLEKVEGTGTKTRSKKSTKKHHIDPLFREEVMAGQLLQNLWNQLGQVSNEYAKVTFGDIEAQYLDKKPMGYWTFERCREEALRYKIKQEFRKDSQAYNAAQRNGWLDEICSHMDEARKPNGYWTLERCRKEALNYKTKQEFRKDNTSAYLAANRKGWIDEICSHMTSPQKPNGYWTLERCREEALKYKTRTKFRKGGPTAYGVVCKNKWLDEVCSHMSSLIKPTGYWTLERCRKEALKYKTRTKFSKGCISAYNAAHKNGWLDEVCAHMN